MEAGYRRADLIELHDAGMVVRTDGYAPAGVGWQDVPSARGTVLSVDGDELARLLQALGISFDADAVYGDAFDAFVRRPVGGPAGRPAEEPPEPARGLPYAPSPRVAELWVRPEGARLLHVHVLFRSGSGQEEEYVQELTYAGSYTIWWSVAEA